MPRPRDPSGPARPSGPGVPPGAAGLPRFHSLLLRRVVSGQDADVLLKARRQRRRSRRWGRSREKDLRMTIQQDVRYAWRTLLRRPGFTLAVVLTIGLGIGATTAIFTIAGPVEPMLWLFLGAVGFVLLIGCVNVANLLLVRATERQQEFAVRASLGAGVPRLVRQLLTESLLLALLGGGVGLFLARWLTDLFLGLAPAGIPRLDEVGLDGTVLVFTLGVTLLTALLFGLTPALRGARTDLNITLRAVRGENRRTLGLRRGLVVVELALALVVLSGAALLGRGFTSLLGWDPGFDREDLVTVWALAPVEDYPTAEALNDLFEQVAEGLRALPEVAAVGMTSAGPLFGGRETDRFRIEGRTGEEGEELPSVRWYDIDPGYLETMGMTLRRGRGVTAQDVRGAPFASLESQALVPPRFVTLLVGMFALIAVLLASIGVYAVVAFTVAGRTREIAVRLALGGALGVFLLVAVLASWLPARRVGRLDPIEALRAE